MQALDVTVAATTVLPTQLGIRGQSHILYFQGLLDSEQLRRRTGDPFESTGSFYFSLRHIFRNISSTMNPSLAHGVHHDAAALRSTTVLPQFPSTGSLIRDNDSGTG